MKKEKVKKFLGIALLSALTASTIAGGTIAFQKHSENMDLSETVDAYGTLLENVEIRNAVEQSVFTEKIGSVNYHLKPIMYVPIGASSSSDTRPGFEIIKAQPMDTNATSVSIPNKIQNLPIIAISQNCFNEFDNLKNISIPESVLSINDSCFDTCRNLESINVNKNNKVYSSVDGVLFNKDKTVIKRVPQALHASTYMIPNSVKKLGSSSFKDCIYLYKVSISDNVKEVSAYPFRGCKNLQVVRVSDNTNVSSDAFKDSPITTITNSDKELKNAAIQLTPYDSREK